MPWSPTLALHTSVRAVRNTYTPIGVWWTFSCQVPTRCFTWVID